METFHKALSRNEDKMKQYGYVAHRYVQLK